MIRKIVYENRANISHQFMYLVTEEGVFNIGTQVGTNPPILVHQKEKLALSEREFRVAGDVDISYAQACSIFSGLGSVTWLFDELNGGFRKRKIMVSLP
jgi:hypothetical protein